MLLLSSSRLCFASRTRARMPSSLGLVRSKSFEANQKSPPLPPPLEKPPPGEGIRSLPTSSIFRAVNFELYAKPNRYMIGLGLFALVLCLTYLVAWSITGKSKNTYVALDDRDQLVSKKKASRWE